MADTAVGIAFRGKDQVTPVVRGIRSTMDRFKRDAATGFGIGAGISVFGMATRAVGMFTDFLGDSVRAAAEEEIGIARLTTSLKENDAAWNGNIEAVEEIIKARERLAFSDETQRESLAVLVSVTKDVNKALELQRTAMDLARLRGMELADASLLIGKVYAGNLGILSRYGIQLKKGTTATEALAEIQKRAAGQAEAYAETAAGSYETLRIEVEDLQEELGTQLLPALKGVNQFLLDNLVPTVKLVGDALGYIGENINIVATGLPGLQRFNDNLKAMADVASEGGRALGGSWAAAIEDVDSATIKALQAERAHKEALDESFESFLMLATGAETANDAYAKLRAMTDAEERHLRDLAFAFVYTGSQASRAGKQIATDFSRSARIVKGWRDEVLREVIDIGPSMRDTIAQNKGEVRAAMTDLKWAMQHPFAGDQYINWLKRKQERAQTLLRQAMRQGKTDAAADARAIVNAIEAELAKLEAPTFATISVDYQTRNRIGAQSHGAKPRAGGGPVAPGNTYLVGERGPELLTMGRQGGQITPNHALGGDIVVNVDGHQLFRIMDARMGRRYATTGSSTYYRTAD